MKLTNPKLNLHRTTVRNLSPEELRNAAGRDVSGETYAPCAKCTELSNGGTCLACVSLIMCL